MFHRHCPLMNSPSSTDLIVQLHREWRRLKRHPSNLARSAGWDVATGPVEDLDVLLAHVGFETRSTPANEVALRDMVAIARHDDLAARLVVQRLLPGALSVVSRQRQLSRDHDAAAEMIGALWIAVRTFNPDRQPSCLAAALIGDAEYLAFKRARRQRSSGERPSDFPLDVAQPERHLQPWEELAELIQQAADAEATDADDQAYLQCLLETPRTVDIARTLNLSTRTIRNRRYRATQRLRAHVAA
jgi:DNA-directed RNA polymerase specialized sigma24 family protein